MLQGIANHCRALQNITQHCRALHSLVLHTPGMTGTNCSIRASTTCSSDGRSQRPSEYHLALAGALAEHSPSTRRALAGVRPWTAFPWKATPGKGAISITVSSTGCKAMHRMSQPSNNIRRKKTKRTEADIWSISLLKGGTKETLRQQRRTHMPAHGNISRTVGQ